MAILTFGVIYMIGSIFFTMYLNLAPSIPENATQEFRESVQGMQSTMLFIRVFMAVFSLGLAGLLSWIVWKLSAKEVRAEFTT
jgi:hypothetical protein